MAVTFISSSIILNAFNKLFNYIPDNCITANSIILSAWVKVPNVSNLLEVFNTILSGTLNGYSIQEATKQITKLFI